MPLIELGNGKTIEIPIEICFYDDEKYEDYIQLIIANDMGGYIEDVFHKPGENRFDINNGFLDDDILLLRDDI